MREEADQARAEHRNFWAWVGYQFFFRIGWQFKMESTLMAGIISFLSPSPAVMGYFTTLNGLGRNLSPFVAAPLVDRFRRKREALLLLWGLTIAAWATLTAVLWLPLAENRSAVLWIFGGCYTLFFLFLGAASVAQGALLGKIIPADRRGRAMAVGMGLSGVINFCSILLVWQLLRPGVFPEPRNYALAFSLTTSFFLISALVLLVIRERPSPTPVRSFNPLVNLRHFVSLARSNRNLSRLMVVNASMSVLGGMLQFYTGYWRQTGTLDEPDLPRALMMATLTQVVWQSGASSFFGRMADRVGNRILVSGLLWIEAIIPMAAWILGAAEPFRSHWAWYLGVYSLVGLRFPMYQLATNYLLEAVPQEEHAMAIGAVTAVQLLATPAPLLLGALAQGLGYPAAFVAGSILGVGGALAARSLREVRPGLTGSVGAAPGSSPPGA